MNMAFKKSGFIPQKSVRISYRTTTSLAIVMNNIRYMLDTTGFQEAYEPIPVFANAERRIKVQAGRFFFFEKQSPELKKVGD